MDAQAIMDYIKNAGPVSVVTFIMGFFVSRWTMSKKERKDYEQKLYENGSDLMEKQNDRFQEFTTSLTKYIDNKDSPTLDDFYQIATSGEKYFYQQKITSDAIMTNKVDARVRDNTLVPSIKETISKSLPQFYKSLKLISDKKGFKYTGQLKRENYESLYLVVEKYGREPDINI
jgi:hypothetical protein